MNNNQKTLEVYQSNFSLYQKHTVQTTSGSQKEWIDDILELLKPNASILEIGSAHGRDATYIRQKGFTIQATDAFEAAVGSLRGQGFDARKLDILNDSLTEKYDLIIALAVFVHFNKVETQNAIRKIKKALKNNGLFAFSVKLGKGEEWSTHKMEKPRYFHYYSEEDILQILSTHGFIVKDMRKLENGKWLHCVVEVNKK